MRYTMPGPVHNVIVFPASRVNIYLNSQHISSSLDRFLHEAYTRDRFWEYADQKLHWTTQTWKLISWPVLFATFNKKTTLKHQ